MKKQIVFLLLALLPIGMMGQPKMLTSRLKVWNRQPFMKEGIDYDEKLISTFRNEMKHDDDVARPNALFIESPSWDGPMALTCDAKKMMYKREDGKTDMKVIEGELVAMKCKDNIWFNIKKKPVVQTYRMKVDDAYADSLLRLMAYACYTSVIQDPWSFVIDGTSYYLFWEEMESSFSNDADEMQQLLQKTLSDIMMVVIAQDEQKVKSFAPTINRLLAHYRSLQLPDQYIRPILYGAPN